MLKKILPIVIVVAGGLLLAQREHWFNSPTAAPVVAGRESTTDAILARAFEEQKSNLQIEGRGVVAKILRDDNDGSRHQRFLVRLNSGQTLLIAHNVDLAPRVADLHEGDAIAFYGEYEWNNKGGVVHWTHRDPSGRHVAGWLEHAGQRYQ